MRGQRAVQLVQLLAAGGGDVDGDAEVIAAFAFPQFQGFRVKGGVKFVRNQSDGVDKTIHFGTHDLDREGAGVDDEGFFDHWSSCGSWFYRIHAAIIALQGWSMLRVWQIAVIRQWLKRRNPPLSLAGPAVQWPIRAVAGPAARR